MITKPALGYLLIAVLFLNEPSNGALDQFVETFDGSGPFDSVDGRLSGFDNSGWEVAGNLGEFQIVDSDPFFMDGGLRFENFGQNTWDDTDLDEVSRYLLGRGSFIESVKIKNVDFGDCIDCIGGGSLRLTHILDSESNSGLAMTVAQPGQPFLQPWQLRIFIIDNNGKEELLSNSEVSSGPDIGFFIDFNESSSEVYFAFDTNLGDDGEPIRFGPFDFLGSVSETQITRLTALAFQSKHSNGILDHWSVVKDLGSGDFNNGILDAEDIDLLSTEVRRHSSNLDFNLNGDETLDEFDRNIWVHDLRDTYFGDSNLDGEFSSADLVEVFQASEYEDDMEGNSTWATGDWNGDGDFNSRDLVVAFADGGYEMGPRAAVRSVPEPSGVLLVFGVICLIQTAKISIRRLVKDSRS